MKKKLLIGLCLTSLFASAQQNLPSNLFKSNKSGFEAHQKANTDSFIDSNFRHFTFYGIGNLSSETLEKLNGGGKMAFLFKTHDPKPFMPKSYFVSFNKNATNNDSLLPSTLIFPEVGNHSFLITAFWNLKAKKEDIFGNNMERQRMFFCDFAMKTIQVNSDDPNVKEQERMFNTLHYTAGFKYSYNLLRKVDEKEYECSFNTSIFLSYTNIPDEDIENFNVITKQSTSNSHFVTAGIKFSLGLNGFQIFADLRHTLTKTSSLPLKDLRGFNSNIGVLFSSEIFRL